jgi:hypothetical protein
VTHALKNGGEMLLIELIDFVTLCAELNMRVVSADPLPRARSVRPLPASFDGPCGRHGAVVRFGPSESRLATGGTSCLIDG